MAKQVLFGYKLFGPADLVIDSGEPHLISIEEAVAAATLRAKRAFPQPVEWNGLNHEGLLTGYVRPFPSSLTQNMVYVEFTQAEIAL